jgi:putative ABC transport system substrate-binding protein
MVQTDRVEVIVAPASTQVQPALDITRETPIVFAQHADPVGLGHVSSLARPGGNVTGVSMLLTDLAGKGLELLHESLPLVDRIAVVSNPTTPSHPQVTAHIRSVASALKIAVFEAPASSVEEFEPAFARMKQSGAGACIVPSFPLTNANPTPLAHLQFSYSLPALFGNRANMAAGGLMSYAADFTSMYAKAADYVDKILRGAKPGDLPVDQASKYEFGINIKAAERLGISLPSSILARADVVID